MSAVTPPRLISSYGPRPCFVIPANHDLTRSVAYLPDGRRVITGSRDGSIKVWNLENGEQEGTSMEHESIIGHLAVTSDGTKLVSSGSHWKIKVWDIESHQMVKEWDCLECSPKIAISPDGQLVAIGNWTVATYNLQGELVNDAIEGSTGVLSISFSPKGDKIAFGTLDDIRLCDVDSGALVLGPLSGHQGEVTAILWSRDGTRLFSGSDDKTIRCWDSATGKQIGQPWVGHTSMVHSLFLSPDGSILASASGDKTVRFWDATSGRSIGQHLYHDSVQWTVSFSPSGEYVASAGRDGELYLWQVPLLSQAKLPNVDAQDAVQSMQVFPFHLPPPHSVYTGTTAGQMLFNTAFPIPFPAASCSQPSPIWGPHSGENHSLRATYQTMLLHEGQTVSGFLPQPLPDPERLLTQVRPITPSTPPPSSFTSLLTVEQQWKSTFCVKSPPAPDLTPYISKANDQYAAAGGFGDVYRCWYIVGSRSPKEVAVKAFRFRFMIDRYENDTRAKMLHRELGIWRRLKHVNVVPFLGIAYGFGMRGSASLVSLWMPNESLHHFLAKHDDNISLGHRLRFLLDIANGLHYLHSFPVVHGDLNSNNVLLDVDYTARLVDFGYASFVGNAPEALAYLQRSTRRPGALRWIAPEQVDPNETLPWTTKSDIYSFGCIALQVLSGKQPWSELEHEWLVILQLSKGENPGRPASRVMDDTHWNLIQHCWSSIEERPATKGIITTIERFLRCCPSFTSLCDLSLPQSWPNEAD